MHRREGCQLVTEWKGARSAIAVLQLLISSRRQTGQVVRVAYKPPFARAPGSAPPAVPTTLRRANLPLVLREHASLSRADISQATGLEINVDYIAVHGTDLSGRGVVERRLVHDAMGSGPGRAVRRVGQLSSLLGPLSVPVRVDNDADLTPLAEYTSDVAAGTLHLVYLTGEVGVGGGTGRRAARARWLDPGRPAQPASDRHRRLFRLAGPVAAATRTRPAATARGSRQCRFSPPRSASAPAPVVRRAW